MSNYFVVLLRVFVLVIYLVDQIVVPDHYNKNKNKIGIKMKIVLTEHYEQVMFLLYLRVYNFLVLQKNYLVDHNPIMHVLN